MKYYLSCQGQQLGPWSEAEILEHLHAGDVQWTDYLYDENQKEWVLLLEFHQFGEALTKFRNETHQNHQTAKVDKPAVSEKEWYVLKSESKYGPFTYLEIIRMLQEKSIYEFDFVWNPKQAQNWQQIADVADFSAEKIKQLQQSKDEEIKEVFFRRRFARKPYGASLLVHNSKSVWKGTSLEISPGGAGIIVDKCDFDMGQTLFLHFKVGDGVPPFNAICSVVSKHLEKTDQYKYGVKFTSISQSVQQAIRNYTEKAA
jgi:hypothetical protein